jgi:hypothetical protein
MIAGQHPMPATCRESSSRSTLGMLHRRPNAVGSPRRVRSSAIAYSVIPRRKLSNIHRTISASRSIILVAFAAYPYRRPGCGFPSRARSTIAFLQPPGGVIRGPAGVGDLAAQVMAVIGVAQVPVPRVAVPDDPVIVGDLEQLRQVPRLPHEPVRVVDDDMPDAPVPGHSSRASQPGHFRSRFHADRFGSMKTRPGARARPRLATMSQQIRSSRAARALTDGSPGSGVLTGPSIRATRDPGQVDQRGHRG